MADTYKLRHILQTFRPLCLRTAAFIPNVHVGHTIGYIVTGGTDKIRQKVPYSVYVDL
jgi:hypothetical protein